MSGIEKLVDLRLVSRWCAGSWSLRARSARPNRYRVTRYVPRINKLLNTPPAHTVTVAALLLIASTLAPAPTAAQPAPFVPGMVPEALRTSTVAVGAVQGAAHRSPRERESVDGVLGIVTAMRGVRGFQMESALPDDDAATSEGIWVYTYRRPAVAVGDLVLVSGRVEEYRPGGADRGDLSVTRIRRPEVTILRGDVALPPPVIVGRGGRVPPDVAFASDADGDVEASPFTPDRDGLDFWESLEGMRVQINDARVVGTVNTRYGEIPVVADGGADATVMTPRGGIAIRRGDLNPERVLIDYDEPDAPLTFRDDQYAYVGDRFRAPVVGILDYSYSWYKILPTEPLPPLVSANLPRTVAPPPAPGEVTIAAFNVQNLSDQSPQEKFADLAETIAVALHNPAIVALQEIQDDSGERNDGVTSAARTLDRLIAAIAAAGGPDYRPIAIDPANNTNGGAPGANIRVAILYDPAQIEAAAGDGAPRLIAPDAEAFRDARKPLVASFAWGSHALHVVSVHFSSKGGDTRLGSRTHPPSLQSEPPRTAQVAEVRRAADALLGANPEDVVVIAGDYNDFAFSAPLAVLTGDGAYANPAESHLSDAERYTYVFEGNSQDLDHIVVSANAAVGARVAIAHRYAEYLYEERATDHDPVILYLGRPRP